MAEVTLVDYGLGNIQAFANIYRKLNVPIEIASDREALARASRLVLPGVGAFDWAMVRLNNSGLRETLDARVLGDKVPVLGVCVGMQMMARESDEGELPGLDWIPARVRKFEDGGNDRLPLPHMGWNDVAPREGEALFAGLEEPQFYFLHSYYVTPDREEDTSATAHYGMSFTAAFAADNIYGTQFHPEKSHHWGIGLLHNFARI